MKTTAYKLCLLLMVAAALGSAQNAFAQQPAAETLEQNVALPQSRQGATPTQTFDQALGEIQPVQSFPKPPTFSASVAQECFYTDNVFYTDSNPVGSAAYLGSYTVNYVPYSTRDWTPQIGLQYNMVRYDRAAAGDFDNEDLSISSNYVISNDRQWSWTSAVDLSRFTSPHQNNGQFYDEVAYDNQIQYVRPIIANSLYFVGAYELAYHQSHPSFYDRVDNAVSLTVAYYPIPQITITPFVRLAAWMFPTDTLTPMQNGRDDFNLAEGLEITWKPNKYLAVVADITRTDDFSNSANQSYAITSPGITLAGTISF
jgi:hypothetical protein